MRTRKQGFFLVTGTLLAFLILAVTIFSNGRRIEEEGILRAELQYAQKEIQFLNNWHEYMLTWGIEDKERIDELEKEVQKLKHRKSRVVVQNQHTTVKEMYPIEAPHTHPYKNPTSH